MATLKIETPLRRLQLETREGETLLEALRRAGVAVTAPCGGNGTCGKCGVLWRTADGERTVPACGTRVETDGTVTLREQAGGAILQAGGRPTAARPGRQGLGAALDLGTTTVVLELLDLSTGESLGVVGDWNAQGPYGADVITRCQYCMENETGTATLQRVIRQQVGALLHRLGREEKDLAELFVAGNTVMEHLYAGLSPAGIARAPFTPQTLFDRGEEAEPGLAYAPCVAGYVGGDITAGLLAGGLQGKRERALFLDIGTNGEMALCENGSFLCCAVASGPAFEGAGIACGMPGVDGAVSRVRWTGEVPELEVIGGGTPRGLCGSGLIDLLAELVRRRIVSAYGRLLGPEEAPPGYEKWLDEDENGNGVFYLTADRSVSLSAGDVRQLQLAKAAVAAGIAVLLQKAGRRAEELETLYLAGGFGSYLNPQNAAAIGMLPPVLAERTVCLGNASLAGARQALLDPDSREELRTIQRSCRYVELSGDMDFNREFPEQMLFYEEEDEEAWN